MKKLNISDTPTNVYTGVSVRVFNSGENPVSYKHNSNGLESELSPGNYIDITASSWLEEVFFSAKEGVSEIIVSAIN